MDKCPKYQYINGDRCDYCMTHCIECSADGKTCSKCHSTHAKSADGSNCEEIGCKVPAKLQSLAKDDLIGTILNIFLI